MHTHAPPLFAFLATLALLSLWSIAAPRRPSASAIFTATFICFDDGTLLVKETITVFSTGNLIRHGIYREFPTRYKDRLGNNYVVGFHWLGATCDGHEETSRLEDDSNGERIYLGDKNSYLAHGQHTYELNYSTNRQLGFFTDHDELYWNVTGNGWAFTDRSRFRHRNHAAQRSWQAKFHSAGYTGPQGSHEKALRSSLESGGQFEFEATRPLAPHEGLSIVLSWNKGLIAATHLGKNSCITFLRTIVTRSSCLPRFWCCCFITDFVWAAVGRDPKRGVIMPLYEPPGNLSPAAMRYLVRMGFDNKTFASAILDLAARGFLKIKFQAGSYTLYRTKTDHRVLTPDEQELANQMFSGREQLWLHNENHTVIGAGMAALKSWLKLNEQKIYFFTNSHYLIPAMVFSVATVATVAYLKSPAVLLVIVVSFRCWLSIWSLAVAGLLSGSLYSVEGGSQLPAQTPGRRSARRFCSR